MRSALLAALLLTPTAALAGAPQLDLSWHPGDSRAELAPERYRGHGGGGRGYDMEVSFRTRMVSIPNSLLNIWFFPSDHEDWAATGHVRPKVNGYSLGLEFVVKGETANGIFWFDYIDSLMGEGYWDDVEEEVGFPHGFHYDGDYLVPSKNLGLVSFGADYAYEVHIVRTEDTNGKFGMSFLVGGGLGVAFMVGEVRRWGPDAAGTPSYVRYDAGLADDGPKDMPRVYPMVDINASLRFNFVDRVVLRIEGGLHTLVYYGATLGVMF